MLVTVGFLSLGLLKVNSTLLAASSSTLRFQRPCAEEAKPFCMAGAGISGLYGVFVQAPVMPSAPFPPAWRGAKAVSDGKAEAVPRNPISLCTLAHRQ